jgi:hypothetical protein
MRPSQLLDGRLAALTPLVEREGPANARIGS